MDDDKLDPVVRDIMAFIHRRAPTLIVTLIVAELSEPEQQRFASNVEIDQAQRMMRGFLSIEDIEVEERYVNDA